MASRQNKLVSRAVITLPTWLTKDIQKNRLPRRLRTAEERMEFAIWLSRRNAEEGTGGPFGTVIVETDTGYLRGVGVNRVVKRNCSLLHGENVAIAMAEAWWQHFTLSGDGIPSHSLYTSAQPCAMCAGAIPWSGVTEVVTGASGYNVETYTGFDEGPIHPNWPAEFRRRGIEVVRGLLRKEACEVLRWYKDHGGIIYSGRTRREFR